MRTGTAARGRANSAVCWGAAGALDRARPPTRGAAEHDIAEAHRQLNHAALRVASGWTGTAWLLDRKAAHAMTVASFDGAIRAMPRPGTPGAVDILSLARTLIARPRPLGAGRHCARQKRPGALHLRRRLPLLRGGRGRPLGRSAEHGRHRSQIDRPGRRSGKPSPRLRRLQARRLRELHRPQRARHPRQRRRHVRPRPRHGARGLRSKPRGKPAMTAHRAHPPRPPRRGPHADRQPRGVDPGRRRPRRRGRARRRRTRGRRLVVRHRRDQLRHVPPCGFPGGPAAPAAGSQPGRDHPHQDRAGSLTLGHYTEATTYNDQTNHGCIVHAFDIAIVDADRHCGKHSSGRASGAENAG